MIAIDRFDQPIKKDNIEPFLKMDSEDSNRQVSSTDQKGTHHRTVSKDGIARIVIDRFHEPIKKESKFKSWTILNESYYKTASSC